MCFTFQSLVKILALISCFQVIRGCLQCEPTFKDPIVKFIGSLGDEDIEQVLYKKLYQSKTYSLNTFFLNHSVKIWRKTAK